jgi:pyruvate,water dikinase
MAITCVTLIEREVPEPTTTAGPPAAGRGLGVGTSSYTGRARVARTPDEALGLLQPGDVLVVPFTTPAYNAVLAIAGGLVTEEGGALSHAAVLARELALPAVIGVAHALTTFRDGDEVELDPCAGTVRILTSDDQPQA